MSGRSLSATAIEGLFVPAEGARSLWAAPSSTPTAETVQLFGLKLANRSVDGAVADLLAAVRARRKTSVVFVNAHVVNTAASDPEYRAVVAAADLRLCDGSGMAIAARLAGQSFIGNPNGTDVFPRLAKRAAETGQKIFLLGGIEGAAAATAETLSQAGCGAAIAGTHHGFFAPGSAAETDLIAQINASGADIVLVGLGVPLQDRWVAANRDRLSAPVLAGVGGLFDYFSGNVTRAPLWLRGLGLEWAWRLAKEPSRLWRRYLVGNAVFLVHAGLNALKR